MRKFKRFHKTPSGVLSIGTSREGNCGVRDYGRNLEAVLSDAAHPVYRRWDERKVREGWAEGLRSDLRLILMLLDARKEHPEFAVFHYSPFGFGAHGIPLLVPLVPVIARILGIQLTTFLHELCYPWGRDGYRGQIWAIVQRLWLLPVVTGSAKLVVSTEARADWLRKRFHISSHRLLTLPVWTNIGVKNRSESQGSPGNTGAAELLGAFGWGMAGPNVQVVIDALELLQSRGVDLQLLMIGSPGPDSAQGSRWRAIAQQRDLKNPLLFTGAGKTEQEVSEAISSVDIAIHTDPAGPVGKSTSLAAVLAHGKPTIALRGSELWKPLVDELAIALVDANAAALANEIQRLAQSSSDRVGLGRRAVSLYGRRMDISVTGPVLRKFVTTSLGGRKQLPSQNL